jgi:hypothetical protein
MKKKMVKIADGAFFVPSYPELTVITYQQGTFTQTVVTRDELGVVEEREPEFESEEKIGD